MKLAADISACAGLTACSLSDIQSGTIPNILILIMILCSAMIIGPDFLLRLFPAMIIALLLFCLKRAGLPMTGGGDLKLFAVMFGWYGWEGLVMIGVGLFVAVGVKLIEVIHVKTSVGKNQLVTLMRKQQKIKLAPYMLAGFLTVKISELMIVNINGGF